MCSKPECPVQAPNAVDERCDAACLSQREPPAVYEDAATRCAERRVKTAIVPSHAELPGNDSRLPPRARQKATPAGERGAQRQPSQVLSSVPNRRRRSRACEREPAADAIGTAQAGRHGGIARRGTSGTEWYSIAEEYVRGKAVSVVERTAVELNVRSFNANRFTCGRRRLVLARIRTIQRWRDANAYRLG